MIIYKTDHEIEAIRKSSLLVSKTLAHLVPMLQPGTTGKELDTVAETFIRDHGAIPAFKGYNGFQGSLCISTNDEVVHGIPNHQPFKNGDIVSLDCGVLLDGFYGDSAYTFVIGEASPENLALLRVTKEALELGIAEAKVGKRIGDIAYAIQHHVEAKGYSVVRELVGHGIGRNLHEAPEVPNFGKRGKGAVIFEGLVIAIEPMINLGKKEVKTASDGWTIKTRDAKTSAHFEHTIAVRKNGAEKLSDFKIIEQTILEYKQILI